MAHSGRSEEGPSPLSRSLGRLIGRMTPQVANAFSVVGDHWEELVGDELAAHSRPIRLEDGTLTITTEGGAYATALKMSWAAIQAGIDSLGIPVPTRISVTVER